MLKSVIAVACLCAASVAGAQSPSLSGQQINDLIAGTTVEIDMPNGTKVRISYGRDGTLSGQARDLASYLGSVADKGRWWVASDRLCHKWQRWFNSEPQCMRLSPDGRIIRWRSQDGKSGTAIISVPASIQAKGVLRRAQPDRFEQIAPPAPASASEERPAALATEKSLPPKDQAEPKRSVQPVFKVANVRSDDVLNVRSGPSADFDIVGELPPGTRGIAITSACRSKWCPVHHRSTSGWVNSTYLAPEELSSPLSLPRSLHDGLGDTLAPPALRDSPGAPRTCLTGPARALLDRIEQQFGPVKVISTCRPGAFIAGTGHPSRHASGNAVDFIADSRKAAIIEWLIANHHSGGTMTYADMNHIHVDIGPHFVSIANGPRWRSWRDSRRDFPGPHSTEERHQ